ncbi:MAG: GNAT family N-acetyltransferase [Armatimonas sp.]
MTYTVRQEAERIHRLAWTAQYAAAPREFTEATGLRVAELAEGVSQYFLPAVPYRMFNRVLGLGITTLLTEELIDTALANFAQAGCEAIALSLTESEPAEKLTARGLVPIDEWVLLTRATEPPYTPASDLEVIEADPETFGSVLAKGYEVPDAIAAWGAALVGCLGWKTYLACDGTQAVGCAAMFLADELAWFGPAATLPESRGRGAQSACFARRIADAHALGCRLIVIEAAPGSTSHRNMLRAGFTELGRRVNFGVPE